MGTSATTYSSSTPRDTSPRAISIISHRSTAQASTLALSRVSKFSLHCEICVVATTGSVHSTWATTPHWAIWTAARTAWPLFACMTTLAWRRSTATTTSWRFSSCRQPPTMPCRPSIARTTSSLICRSHTTVICHHSTCRITHWWPDSPARITY